MAVFQKKQKEPAPVLSKEALLNVKREAWQDSETKVAWLAHNHSELLQQKATLEREHHNSLIASRNE